MALKTRRWDAAETLKTKEDRANLYKALSPEGNPEFATVAKVLRALGLRLTIAA